MNSDVFKCQSATLKMPLPKPLPQFMKSNEIRRCICSKTFEIGTTSQGANHFAIHRDRFELLTISCLSLE